MSQFDWLRDPLAYLIGPLSGDEFFRDYHEQKPLLALRDDPDRYKDLLSLDRIDDVIASMDLAAGDLDMARTEPPVRREDYTYDTGIVDRGAVIDQFNRGATIILPHLHTRDATLAAFCRAMESVFCTHLQTNIYLTPPNNQGFNIHYDDHDVFVLQVSGQKDWRFYNTPIQNPFRGEAFHPDIHKAGDPVESFTMKAGDCIYVPRGLMHDARTAGDEPSLHITVGLIVKTWADLMLEAVSEVALREPAFRRSLPPGFAQDNYDKAEAQAYFKELIAKFAGSADFEESFELFVENFIRSRSPNTRGGVVDASQAIEDGDRFRLRINTPHRLRSNEDEALLIAPGGEIPVPMGAVEGLERALSGEVFGIEVFAGLAAKEAETVLRKLIAFGLVERVQG
jgi:hypothetical protein